MGISVWDEHPPFMAALLAQLSPSHPDPRGSGGKAGAEADVDCRVTRLFPAGLSAPIPCHSRDSVPPPALREGGPAVMGHFLGITSVHKCSSTVPVEVTRATGEEWGQSPWSKSGLSGC